MINVVGKVFREVNTYKSLGWSYFIRFSNMDWATNIEDLTPAQLREIADDMEKLQKKWRVDDEAEINPCRLGRFRISQRSTAKRRADTTG